MISHAKKITFLGCLLTVLHFASAAPAEAALYDWVNGTNVQSVIDTTGDAVTLENQGSSGADITKAWYAYDADSIYFRMDLAGTPTKTGMDNYAHSYGIYIDTNLTTAGNTDIARTLFLRGGGNQGSFDAPELLAFADSSWTTVTNATIGFSATTDRKTLEWSVRKDAIGTLVFDWYAATIGGKNNTTTLRDSTNTLHATPLPAAAWLFGTGALTLLGLKRRRS